MTLDELIVWFAEFSYLGGTSSPSRQQPHTLTRLQRPLRSPALCVAL